VNRKSYALCQMVILLMTLSDHNQPKSPISPILYIWVFSKRELTFTFAICCRCLSVICLSVTLVRPSQAVEIFQCHLVPWPSVDIHRIFYGGRPRGTPPPGGLNTGGEAKYSDFGPIEGYISETVQDRR